MQPADTIIKPYYGIFNDSYPPIMDGVTLTVENYVYWLAKKGFNPCVVTPWNPVRRENEEKNTRVMRFFSLPIQSRKPYRYGYPKLDPFIWHRLRTTPFQILHSHCPFSSGRLAVYVKKHQHVPLIGTFHSKYESDLKHSFKHTPWMVPIIMKRILNFFNACDEVWIPQAQVEETVRQYGYKGHLEVVENGIDYADRAKGDILPIKRHSRTELGVSEGKLSLLFVGQHIWEKGIGIIADALGMLKGKVPFHMNFVGNGYAIEDLRHKIQDMGLADCVKINGIEYDRDRLADYYAAADLFLFPSLYDNAPLVLREAAALGTPGILPYGSTASEVIKDGLNGFLTTDDAAGYAAKIEYLWNNPHLIASAAAGARSSLVRSWEDVVNEVIDRYNVIIKNHR